jgi:hypothetical protein
VSSCFSKMRNTSSNWRIFALTVASTSRVVRGTPRAITAMPPMSMPGAGICASARATAATERRPAALSFLSNATPADHGDWTRFELKVCALGDRFLERDAVGAVRDVDAKRWHAHLEDAGVRSEVRFANLELRERRAERREGAIAERCEGAINAFRVLSLRADEHVQVLGAQT